MSRIAEHMTAPLLNGARRRALYRLQQYRSVLVGDANLSVGGKRRAPSAASGTSLDESMGERQPSQERHSELRDEVSDDEEKERTGRIPSYILPRCFSSWSTSAFPRARKIQQ